MIKTSGPNSTEFVMNIMQQVSSLVEVTYGPYGGFVVLSNGETSLTTKDGVSVIRALVATDQLEQAVINVIREAALNTLAKAGDGTTTTVVLASKILSSFSPSDFMHKDYIIQVAKDNIRKKSKDITIESDEIEIVAMTSTAGDKELSETIVSAFKMAEQDGISGIIAEPRIGGVTSVEVVKGINFTGNIIDLLFYDNKDSRTRVSKDCHMIFSTSEISGEEDIVELITTCVNNGVKDLAIIAPSFAMTSLSALSINHGVSINLLPIAIDGGDAAKTKMAIEALSASVNGTVVGESSGVDICDIDPDMLTHVERISVSGKSITITGEDVSENKEATQLIDYYQGKMRSVASDEERDMFKTLLSILKKKLIKVIIGGNTINAITERKDRADDCINSVELALKGGVVPGGGAAYTNMGLGSNCRSNINGAVEQLSLIVNGGDVSGSGVDTLDPTIVAETVAEQAIELAFILGMTKSVVLTQ
jgi:chaperonin GroEL